jgi:hypothetical protein
MGAAADCLSAVTAIEERRCEQSAYRAPRVGTHTPSRSALVHRTIVAQPRPAARPRAIAH